LYRPPKPRTAQRTTLANESEALKIETPLRYCQTGGRLFIGASGRQHANWRGDFRPMRGSYALATAWV